MPKLNVSIIGTEFRRHEIQIMIARATARVKAAGCNVEHTLYVPGCYEIPLAADWILSKAATTGILVFGIIERGENAHGMVLGRSVSDGLIALQLKHSKPIGIGIIGPNAVPTQIQALMDIQSDAASNALLKMSELVTNLRQRRIEG